MFLFSTEVQMSNELGVGEYIVGRDIKPGTYKLSTLYLQSAFFIENWRSAILYSRMNEVTYGYVCDGRSPSQWELEHSDLRMWMRATKE